MTFENKINEKIYARRERGSWEESRSKLSNFNCAEVLYTYILTYSNGFLGLCLNRALLMTSIIIKQKKKILMGKYFVFACLALTDTTCLKRI